MSVGLRGIAGVLGPQEIGLADLVIQNRVSSSERTLSAFGFERVYVAEHPGAAQELACQAAESAMQDANVSADEIDLVIWASARAENHLHVSEHQNGDAPHVWLLNIENGRALIDRYREIDCRVYEQLRPYDGCIADIPGLSITSPLSVVGVLPSTTNHKDTFHAAH
jgi:hypothetical protein